tara:strand:- start:867 stop:1565 length:699 start_codon:yes stop_codon:yes gene_type:complete
MRRRTVKKKRSKSKRIMSQKRKTVPTNIPLKKSKQTNIKFCMISYQGNADFAKLTKKVLKKEWGYSCKIFWGYKIDGDKYTHTNVIFEGIKDKMLSFMKNHNGPIYYIEDDIRFTEDPLKIPKKDVVWSVYRRGNLGKKRIVDGCRGGCDIKPNKHPHEVITGSQAIYFSKKAVQALYKHMNERKRSIQIDSYFSEFIRKHPKLTFRQMLPSMGYEETHESLIDQFRDLQKK